MQYEDTTNLGTKNKLHRNDRIDHQRHTMKNHEKTNRDYCRENMESKTEQKFAE